MRMVFGPVSAIDRAVEKIKSGTITRFVDDPKKVELMFKANTFAL